MIVDPKSISSGAMYHFMNSVVVPRPIAFVSTVGANGQFNVAPFSYYNAIANRPPLIGVSILHRPEREKDTLRNVRDTGDFVVNVVDEPLHARMVEASGDWPQDVDEFTVTGLTPVPSDLVRSPRVGESPVHLECRLHREVELGNVSLVVGEIVRVHIRDDVLTDGRVDPEKLKPVGRLSGDAYAYMGQLVHVARPKVENPPKP